MKKAVLCVAFAGLAGHASAANFYLDFQGFPTAVASGDTFEFQVTASADVGTHILGGGFGLRTTRSDVVSNVTWTPANWSAFNEDIDGYDGNGNYGQVVFGQLLLPIPGFDVPAAGSELGSAIGTFQVQLSGWPGFGFEDQWQLIEGVPFTLDVYDVDTHEIFNSSDGNLYLNGVLVPSPSGLALLGFCGMVTGRRRRD